MLPVPEPSIMISAILLLQKYNSDAVLRVTNTNITISIITIIIITITDTTALVSSVAQLLMRSKVYAIV